MMDLKVDYFPKDEPPDSKKVLDCAETLLGGGTDFERPLAWFCQYDYFIYHKLVCNVDWNNFLYMLILNKVY